MRRRRRTAFTAPTNFAFLEAPTPSLGDASIVTTVYGFETRVLCDSRECMALVTRTVRTLRRLMVSGTRLLRS
eukprot:2246845-Pyramimonas_sp.AAC.1